MISFSLLLQLFDAIKRNDTSNINKILRETIAIAEKKKNHRIAKELRQVYSLPYPQPTSWDDGKSYGASASSLQNGSRKLFDIRESDVNLSHIILSEKNIEVFNEIKEGYINREILKRHGLFNDGRVLLFGPPGTGKTLFAYALSGELKIPIIHVYLDSLISSYLGETGKNLGSIFREAQSQSCILFLDEFDAVAKQRDDRQELGELKRVVTVLLQNIDELSPNTLLLAATNHEHLLDPAIWRRFDYQINLDYLDRQARIKLLNLFLGKNAEKEIPLLADLSENLSGAIVKQIVNKSLRKHVLQTSKENFDKIILQEFAVLLASSKNSLKENRKIFIQAIKVLRGVDSGKYTFDYLEKVTGVPSSTIHNIVSSA